MPLTLPILKTPSISTMPIRLADDSPTAVLTFDRPNSSANILDGDILRAFSTHLEKVAEDPEITGLIITSAKPSIFIAGADLSTLQSAPPDELDSLIELGQSVFQQLADLKIPTVAAIHGACVGGGLELALACDYRVASDSKSTRLGLPETQLGILPAWGGTTRLPRLIGLPSALGLILTGKLLRPYSAKKAGLVDEIVPRAHLEKFATSLLARGKRKEKFRLANTWPIPNLIHRVQSRNLGKKTHGNYPALGAALGVACRGILTTSHESLRLEREAVAYLAKTPEAKNLIRTFFLTERAKKLPDAHTDNPIRNTAVVGAGVMGAGIASWFATREHPVLLTEIGRPELAAGMQRIVGSISAAESKHILTKVEARNARDRISPSSAPVPLTNTDLIVEAAVEKLDIKKKIFADLAARSRKDTILATNTSALPVTALAEAHGVTHPERVIGLHFFNPVARMKLVEIVVTPHTSDDVLDRAITFVRSIGKLPVVVKDSPGFVVNRILVPYLVAAGNLFNCGTPAEEIDGAMLGFGMPMGPLRLLDEIGNDVALHVAKSLEAGFGRERMPVPNILTRMVEAKLLGKKSGSGFYTYPKKKTPYANPIAASLRRPSIDPVRDADDITHRLVVPMLVEASRVLHEGVVDDPRDIDFAMIMGTGFAPFRGGPLRYADTLSPVRILALCQEFRIPPGSLLPDLAKTHSKFY